jgi:hypothetical protein
MASSSSSSSIPIKKEPSSSSSFIRPGGEGEEPYSFDQETRPSTPQRRKRLTPSIPNTDEAARITTSSSPMPKYQRIEHIDSGVFDTKRLEGVIDRLEFGDRDHSYKMFAEVLKSLRPSEVNLWDEFHAFSHYVAGGCNVKTFWKDQDSRGHAHFVKIVHEALVQPKYSWPVSEVPLMPFTVHHLEVALREQRMNQPDISPRDAILNVILVINHNTEHYRVELSSSDETDDSWMTFKHGNMDLANNLWSKLNVRHLKHPFVISPSRLSIESWLEQIKLDKKRTEIALILSKPGLTDNEAIHQTMAAVLDPGFWFAFLRAMNVAQQKFPNINFIHPKFIELLKNTRFGDLVIAYYRDKNVKNHQYLSNRYSRYSAASEISAALSLFLNGESAFRGPLLPPPSSQPITAATETLIFTPSQDRRTRSILSSSIF